MSKESLQNQIHQILKNEFQLDLDSRDLLLIPTKKEFKGDHTLTVFPIAGKLKMKPMDLAVLLGEKLKSAELITDFEVVQGFLNLTLNNNDWLETLRSIQNKLLAKNWNIVREKILVEFCSPNTNKPLHLGHIRNMLLGESTARMLSHIGHDVKRIQVINDRGIAICKSMISWKKWGNNGTPDSKQIKGDHFVGDYYVLFEKEFSKEYNQWQLTDIALFEYGNRKDKTISQEEFFKEYKNKYFNQYSTLGKEARELLLKWEENDESTIQLWKQMNGWVYNGFNETFHELNIQFDHIDYESITYLLGKETVENGLAKKVFYQKDDHSIWIDLTKEGLDHKVVLRADGTSVYITQDLGTAQMRYEKFGMNRLIYVVADEQDYHFKVLFKILKKLGEPYANGLFHLSYGMVELPEGKMKSREGTVVDADDLISEVLHEALLTFNERGELDDVTEVEKNGIIEAVAMGAIKFFMLKVNPKKRMVFNPKESLDFQGQTGPYVQNAYVRIQSILKKSTAATLENGVLNYLDLKPEEKELIGLLDAYHGIVLKSAENYDPSELANYSYSLAKAFHKFYHEVPILRSENKSAMEFRLSLAQTVGNVLKESFYLLGIEMPDRM